MLLLQKVQHAEVFQKNWSTVKVIPIYQRESAANRGIDRPITLLLHVGKVIEGGIAAKLMQTYKYSDVQLGFQQITGADNAMNRHKANRWHILYTAVLDLKSAYNILLRSRLMHVVVGGVPWNLAKMLRQTIQLWS